MYFSQIWFFWTIIIGINVSVLRYRWFPIFLSISLYIYLHRFTDWPAELKSKEQMLLMYTELPHGNQDTTRKRTHWILYSHSSSLYTSRLESICFFEQIGIKMRNYLKSKRQIVSLHLVANYVKQEWKIPFSEMFFFTMCTSWNYIPHWPDRYERPVSNLLLL